MFNNVHQCSTMFTNVHQCSTMFNNVTDCSAFSSFVGQSSGVVLYLKHLLPYLQFLKVLSLFALPFLTARQITTKRGNTNLDNSIAEKYCPCFCLDRCGGVLKICANVARLSLSDLTWSKFSIKKSKILLWQVRWRLELERKICANAARRQGWNARMGILIITLCEGSKCLNFEGSKCPFVRDQKYSFVKDQNY